MRVAASTLSPATAGLVFVLTLIGFASKAGILPLHAWLPRAHPEAPSHVSALMSAAMVTLGVYGIVRVGFDLLGGGARWWWLLVLALGAVSAVYGILQAAIGTDLKRLLAYSTTENMGLVLVGVGAGGLFAAAGNMLLAGLALTAALLHVINHAAFKTLLFLAAGSVLHATGSRDLDSLGGLRPGMPGTTAAFGIGALAGSALPLGPGVRQRVAAAAGPRARAGRGRRRHGGHDADRGGHRRSHRGAGGGDVREGVRRRVPRAAPQSEQAANARESPPTMLAGMGVAGVACVVLALTPALVLPAVGAGERTGVRCGRSGVGRLVDRAAAGVRRVPCRRCWWPRRWWPRRWRSRSLARLFAARHRARVSARLWDCGAGPLSARMEYTATSFAEPLQRVFDDVVRPEHDVDVTHYRESRYLVDEVSYRLRVPDRIEHRLYRPVLAGGAGLGPGRAAVGQRQRAPLPRLRLRCRCVALLILLVVTR